MKKRALQIILASALAGGTAFAETDAGHTPYGGAPAKIPGLIEAEHYDEGPAGVAYQDKERVNQGAPYRKRTEVDIEKLDKVPGMNICISTTAKTDDEARALRQHMGMPFRQVSGG